MHYTRERAFRVEVAPVSAFALSHDGGRLAAVDRLAVLRIWSVESGQLLLERQLDHRRSFEQVSWASEREFLRFSDDGRLLLLQRHEYPGPHIVNASSGNHEAALNVAWVDDASWAQDGESIFVVGGAPGVHEWRWRTGDEKTFIPGSPWEIVRRSHRADRLALGGPNLSIFHRDSTIVFELAGADVRDAAWSPDGEHLAFCRKHARALWVWTPLPVGLEGHQAGVEACAYLDDGRHLASIDSDRHLIVWDVVNRAPVLEEVPGPSTQYGTKPVFGGAPLRYVELLNDDRTLYVYPPLVELLKSGRKAAKRFVHHTSAKVVISGEPRVGKTSLAHRLVTDEYAEHESTHGAKVWSLPQDAADGERREVMLWDLGGQEEYQLIHQLFLHDTTVALLLFDPLRGAQALEEVEAWLRRFAVQRHGGAVRKLLVCTKVDGVASIDTQGIEGFVRRCGLEGPFFTSARSGHGIPELRAALLGRIDWNQLTTASRPELFQRIRDDIDARRGRGEVVVHYLDLLKDFRPEDHGAVDTVVRQLAMQGAIADTRDAQQERTLVLQFGEVERYAGSLIIAARDNPSGVPALEKAMFSARLKDLPRISPKDRLDFREERWVLECVLQLLLDHGLCLEHAGLYVFPTLFRMTDAMPPEPPANATPIIYVFSGAIENIYSSLVTALGVSQQFGRMRLGKDRAEFEGVPGAICGLRKVDLSAGTAHLDVYFGESTPDETRQLFLDFVKSHLREHGVEMVERIEMKCSECQHLFDEPTLRARLNKGETTVLCQLCEHRNRIDFPSRSSTPTAEQKRRTVALRGAIAEGKRQAVDRARALIPREETSPARPRPARILHLSDLHISEQDDVESLLGPLQADVTGPLDYLVVSGDLTNRAFPAELTRAYEFLKALIERLHLSAQRCIVVPGNHDLCWDESVYDFRMARQVPEPRDPRTHVPKGDGFLVRSEERYPRRFLNFHQHLFHPLFQREYPLDPKEQALAAFFPEHGLQFIALNSACEIDEQFPDRAGMHEAAIARALAHANAQLRDVKPGTAITRVAVWHHPVTGNEKIRDDAFLEQLRKADVRLCLHGHVHEDRADLVAHADLVRRLYTVGAGSFGALAKHRPESTPRLYNIIELDPEHRWFRVHTRARPRSGGAWGPWAVWPSNDRDQLLPLYEVPLPPPFLVGEAP